MPFRLAEAVSEYGLWARSARTESWNSPKNQRSLKLDISRLSQAVGPRLTHIIQGQLEQLNTAAARDDIVDCAERFDNVWRDRASISAAFRDLCEAASRAGAVTRDLRKLAEILASQLGPAAQSPWNALRDSATALAGEPHDFQVHEWFGDGASMAILSAEDRLRVAEDLIIADSPVGEVVVWIAYHRAMVSWRVDAGPITFLRADWMLPNARREDGQDFPERDELRILFENTSWMKDVEGAINDPKNMLVLARVSMGKRAVAGALEEAKRRIEAILSIVVGAGGVSWQSTGASATMIDGRVATSTLGLDLGGRPPIHDTYGISATTGILEDVAERLNVAMAERPMPEYLVEALVALREAGMTDHRDVSLYGARAVTPRIATALQDHALELIASVASVTPTELAKALEEREVDWQFEQDVLGGIMGPFDRSLDFGNGADRRTLELAISEHDGATRVVSVSEAVELQAELLSLPMTDLTQADLTDALRAVTDPEYEAALLQSHREDVEMMRERHRRVRNAINHGNPLTATALESTRGFAERNAQGALWMALEAYASDNLIASLLADERANRQRQRDELAQGRNYVERNRRPDTSGSPLS